MAVSWTWKIPYRKFFKFNNSAIYPHSEQTLQDVCDSSGEEAEGGAFSRMFWDMGINCSKVVEPLSLLMHEVVKESQRLETTINSLQPQIQEGLAKIEDVQHEERMLKDYESAMDRLTNILLLLPNRDRLI